MAAEKGPTFRLNVPTCEDPSLSRAWPSRTGGVRSTLPEFYLVGLISRLPAWSCFYACLLGLAFTLACLVLLSRLVLLGLALTLGLAWSCFYAWSCLLLRLVLLTFTLGLAWLLAYFHAWSCLLACFLSRLVLLACLLSFRHFVINSSFANNRK